MQPLGHSRHISMKRPLLPGGNSVWTNAGRRYPPTIRVEPARRSSSSSKGRSRRLATGSCAQGTKVAAPMSEAGGFHSSRAVSCSAFSAIPGGNLIVMSSTIFRAAGFGTNAICAMTHRTLERLGGLRLGSIEHRVEKIALDHSDDHFAHDQTHLHVSEPCLNG